MRNRSGEAIGAIVSAAVVLMVGRVVAAGSLDPTNAPAPTMHTLEDIYQKVAVNQVLSPLTTFISAGNYAATNLAEVDTDLTATNIKHGVVLFGITGTFEGSGITFTNTIAVVPRTGLTTSYATNDDGGLQKGMAWPNPRFAIGTNTNQVIDNLTGLIWARDANLLGATTWGEALSNCNNLAYGGSSDWRLPNWNELRSLIDAQFSNPALCDTTGTNQWSENSPFINVQSSAYWSSTRVADHADHAWCVLLSDGSVSHDGTAGTHYVWPVLGGYVPPSPVLVVLPTSANLESFGSSVTFTASGGIPPYLWEVEDTGIGSFPTGKQAVGQSATYTRTFAGSNTVTLSDSVGNVKVIPISQP
jgi:hypothetical protein